VTYSQELLTPSLNKLQKIKSTEAEEIYKKGELRHSMNSYFLGAISTKRGMKLEIKLSKMSKLLYK
jgi:hypothetical protein